MIWGYHHFRKHPYISNVLMPKSSLNGGCFSGKLDINDGFQDFRANPPPFETQKQEALRLANLQTSLQVICSVAYG